MIIVRKLYDKEPENQTGWTVKGPDEKDINLVERYPGVDHTKLTEEVRKRMEADAQRSAGFERNQQKMKEQEEKVRAAGGDDFLAKLAAGDPGAVAQAKAKGIELAPGKSGLEALDAQIAEATAALEVQDAKDYASADPGAAALSKSLQANLKAMKAMRDVMAKAAEKKEPETPKGEPKEPTSAELLAAEEMNDEIVAVLPVQEVVDLATRMAEDDPTFAPAADSEDPAADILEHGRTLLLKGYRNAVKKNVKLTLTEYVAGRLEKHGFSVEKLDKAAERLEAKTGKKKPTIGSRGAGAGTGGQPPKRPEDMTSEERAEAQRIRLGKQVPVTDIWSSRNTPAQVREKALKAGRTSRA